MNIKRTHGGKRVGAGRPKGGLGRKKKSVILYLSSEVCDILASGGDRRRSQTAEKLILAGVKATQTQEN